MIFEKLTCGTEVGGTHLQGSIDITYTELLDIFASPSHVPPVGEKTQAEWWLLFPDGTIATIYDWKSMYPTEDVRTWNIGGKDKDAEYQVKQAVEEHRASPQIQGGLFDA
jgi:hypothetical protein